MEQTKLIEEFETMRDLAELKSLSDYSLKYPISDEQFKRMMELRDKLFGEK